MTWEAGINTESKRGLRGAHVLKEDLEDTTGLLVDETGDTLDTATAGQTTDSGLGDTWSTAQPEQPRDCEWRRTLDVVTKNLAVTLSTALSETLHGGNSELLPHRRIQ